VPRESGEPHDRSLAPEGYQTLLGDLKERIRSAQARAALAVNRELVLLYWQLGNLIASRQEEYGWGTRVIDRLAADLRQSFPDMKGFSTRNLRYMRAFAATYPDLDFVQQVAAHMPWGHTMRLLDVVKEPSAREWYMRQAVERGWSRDMMARQIESDLYRRQGQAQTNFTRTLPATQSDLARQVLKDPYNFDFLTLGDDALERDLERGLLAHIQAFLLELGVGFAFVGSQFRLEVDGQEYFIDLLFYHYRLRAFVVIDLKMFDFQPEYAGKMNFYLSAVDDLLRHPDDQPSIGIILCKSKKKVVAEYALRNVTTPIGISSFQLMEALPTDMRGNLPTIEELEATLGDTDGDEQ